MIGILLALGATFFVTIAGLGLGLTALACVAYGIATLSPLYVILGMFLAFISYSFVRLATFFVSGH